MEKIKGKRRRLRGIVVSAKMEKTVKVKVMRVVQHPRYRKYIKKYKNYIADTKGKTYEVGDEVIIEESRPISKLKRWVVVSKV
uniref:Small ribosomal subunit protein uS17 n=1 Tax=candidate division CPR3 bacterium TaxID=2268181 RepID=A0A7C5USN9_UNCC3